MTGWTRSNDGEEIIRLQAEPSSPSPFPVVPPLMSYPSPVCHARLPCVMPVSRCVMPASRVSCLPPICHSRPPFVIPAKAGIQSLFPIRHVLVTVSAGGRASLALPLDSR